MCKTCVLSCVVTTIALWGFFAVLLYALSAGNASINAIWLTMLAIIAIFSCPLTNPKLLKCCDVPGKKK